ncbi:FadR/GntR family transcriptional regulator [Granulicella arctica]|uniref:GntR family transcriptional repressor for pyruvate dehydrogenase complex n=1 Tax=Granulicella arctica TaxID=940613 RepID=A0A7Y9PFZ8_9BACT|nr:FCD domain-containing protein [Granulicella arctica]NYF79005.1 GntR family transcriptional repressor for pyruvate dehydrogenase complex [Granulicella arctica]
MNARRKPPLGHSGDILSDKDDVTHLLILRFQQLLSDGLLSPGAKLPPERELAASFGVARSSLRPALKVLEIMGVITQKVGDGSYLNKDASSVLAVPMEFLFLLDDISLEELTEMRLMVEPALAAKAAERANADDIALLRQSISDLERSKQDRIRLVASDLLFHRAIFQASGNRLTGRLFHIIHRAMLNMIMLTSQLVELEHTLDFHKPIFAAIEQRNPTLAFRLMTDHLVDANNLVLQSREQYRERKLRDHLSSEVVGPLRLSGDNVFQVLGHRGSEDVDTYSRIRARATFDKSRNLS